MWLFRKWNFLIFKVSNSNMPQFFLGKNFFFMLSKWAKKRYLTKRHFNPDLIVVINCWVVGVSCWSALECVINWKSREKIKLVVLRKKLLKVRLSQWIYEIINFQKMNQKIWRIYALRVFIVHRAEILQIFSGHFWGNWWFHKSILT